MFLFFKKKRKKKKKKYIPFGILSFFLIIIGFILWSFSPFLFLLSNSFNILGMDEKKTYLITLHNEGELRPNLGFLTGFIFLEINKGNISLEFHDSYDITPPPIEKKIVAPSIIEKTFSKDPRYQGWVFRDSNFSPLYYKNVQEYKKFLQYDQRYKNKKIDGVISIDLYALGEIIDSIGGVKFLGENITSQNIFSTLEKNAKTFDHHSKKEWLERKSSIKPLAKKILKKILVSPFSWRKFSRTIEKLGKEKHFLVFFENPDIQKSIDKKNWSNNFEKIFPKGAFFIGHNIANLGGKKGDRYIQKDFSSVFFLSSKGKISEKLSLRLQHNGTRNLHSDRYFAYIRIFRPKGTILKSFKGEFDIPPQKITNINQKSLPFGEEFSFFIHIDESSEKIFSFTFSYLKKIPFSQKNPQNFFIFSQPGKVSRMETQSIVFQGEGDTSFIIQKNNSGFNGCDFVQVLENITRCEIVNSGNKIISLFQKKDMNPPILEESIIEEGGKTLRLQFSENIQYIFPSEIFIKEKNTKRNIEIIDVKQTKRGIIIYLKNPLKIGDFYLVYIDDVTDIFGNSISSFKTTVKRNK